MNKLRFFAYLTLAFPALCRGEVTEIVQTPNGHAAPPDIQSQTTDGPDERILWSLLHAGKIDALRQQIGNLKARFPAWQVPQDLQNALSLSDKKTQASKQSARAYRTAKTGCARIDRQWQNAEVQLARGHIQAAVNRYADIIGQCKNPKLIRTTLEKAAKLPDRTAYFHLTALASGRLAEVELQGLNYQWLKNAFLNRTDKNLPEPELLTAVEQYKDADIAVVIAWRFFDRQAYRQAYAGFDKAGQWRADHSDARLGKMLSLEKLGKVDAALALYPSGSADAGLNQMAGRLYKLKAWQYLNASNLPRAEQSLTEARAVLGPSDPEILEIEAWIADRAGDYAKAAVLFDTLYRQSPGNEFARAYVRNQEHINRDALEYQAERAGGPLLDAYRQMEGRDLYQRKQFLAGYALTPAQFPNLVNIDAPSADLGVYARHKSGEPGLGRLDILKMPTSGGELTVNGVHHFRLSVSRVELNSGSHDACSKPVGALFPLPNQNAIATCDRLFENTFTLTDSLNGGLETDFLYRMDGWFSPYVRLGHTPTGGVIDPAITFDVGFVQQTESGHWSLNVYSEPVRQSMLSYTGIRDPYLYPVRDLIGPTLDALGFGDVLNSLEWGRVLRSGIRASGYHRFNRWWGFFGSAEVAMLNGKNVADNTAFAVSVNPGFNIPIKGFDYFSVGPAIAYQHFEKNLSHFTLGQGGYFSPEHYINAGPSLEFLTDEGRAAVLKGHVSAGVQLTKQSDSPWFPLLNPGLGSYQDDKGLQITNALDIELKGVWLMAPHFQLGAGAAVRHTANYQDYTGGLFLRVFFQGRKASFSSDIPNAMFNDIQFY
ncbi:cellulose synthase subunit BcsC-related outer membrane protein [Methylomonas sp. MgM2]